MGRFLIESHDVSRRISEPCSNLGRVCADRLYDLAPVSSNRIEHLSNVIHHDVEEKAWSSTRRPSEHPCAAHLSSGVIECKFPVSAGPNVPTKDMLVEICGLPNFNRGHLDVADLSVCRRWWHERSLTVFRQGYFTVIAGRGGTPDFACWADNPAGTAFNLPCARVSKHPYNS